MVMVEGTIEGGWAHLDEVDCYEYIDNDLYNASHITDISNWQQTTLNKDDILTMRLTTVSGTFLPVDVLVLIKY